MGDLATFIRARLDEDLADLEHMTGGALVQGYLRVNGDRLKADLHAKQRILNDLVPEISGMDGMIESEWGHHDPAADRLLELLALPYAEHVDWKTDLRFRVQMLGNPVEVYCNPDVEARVLAAATAAGIADLITLAPSYIVPGSLAFIAEPRDLPDDFYAALTLERWI